MSRDHLFLQETEKRSKPPTAVIPILVFWVAFGHTSTALAAVDWPTLGFTQAVTNTFNRPACIAHAGDNSQRLFVVQQQGQILIIQNSNVLAQPFLDISPRVTSTGSEQGLLGLAFPPGFPIISHFYVYYTISSNNSIVVSRFQLTSTNANVADANSEQRLLIIPKPFINQNGGQLAFGPDGYLYIGTGDGGGNNDPQNNGQKTNSLLGKILRIDVEGGAATYSIPASNPFVNIAGYSPEIWALGLHNPWGFSFDRGTGDLYIGDMGYTRFEEIDFQLANSPGGLNYGWRIMEGLTNSNVPLGYTNFASLTLPIATYSHSILPYGSGEVTGGYVYRGPSEPRMDGMYFYGDYVVGWIWGLKQDGTNWQSFPLLTPGINVPSFIIRAFGEDDLGQLYLADAYESKLYRVDDTRQVWAPTFSPTTGIINSNTVTMFCASPGAEIHYTTNGIDPTLSDPIISSGALIQVSNGFTNKARGFRSDLMPSSVTKAVYTFQVGTPIFTPPAGSITNRTPISITTVTPNATIFYTTNGANPSTNSPVYSNPITFVGNTTLKALAVAAGFSNSGIRTASYSIIPAATPTFSPVNILLTNSTNVAISCSTPGATIRYTLDGTDPTINSTVYTSPIEIDLPVTLKARAYRDDLAPGAVQSFFYAFVHYESTVVTTLAGSPTAGFSNALGRLAQFSTPQAICFDTSGNLLVGDRGNHVIRKLLPTTEVQTFAGSGILGHGDGPASTAQFEDSAGVCCDAYGNVFVSEGGCGAWRIREVNTNLVVSTIGQLLISCYAIGQIEVDPADNLYAAYGGDLNKVTLSAQVTTLGDYGGYSAYVGVGIDPATNLYAAEASQVWKIAPTGTQTLIAGNATTTGFTDGASSLALFGGLHDAVVDTAGDVLLSDLTRVRKLSPAGQVTTIAGTGIPGYVNGRGSIAQFDSATGICVDTNGNIFVTDTGNNCIRKISPDTAGIGIADDWQIGHFGHIGIDPNADPDRDGMSNFDEFWAGTDPLDANSALRIDTVLPVSGLAQIRWQTVAGKTYVVQYSANLVSWTNLGSPVFGNGSTALLIDPTSITQGQRFYRVVLTGF